MKRSITAFLLALVFLSTSVLIPCSASAEGLDYSALTTAELQDIIADVRNELIERKALSEGNLFLIDEVNDLQIYLTGKGEKDWMGGYNLEIVVINNGSRAVSVSFDHVVINGWETDVWDGLVQDVGAGKKKKGYLPLAFDEADISSISEVEEVEISFHTFDPSTYMNLNHYGPFTIYYDGSNWFSTTQ